MEKILFKFIQKLHEPKYIGSIFLSFIFIGLAPIVRSVLTPNQLTIYSILALFPLTVYLSSLFLMLLMTMPQVMGRIKLLVQIEGNILTVKQVARKLNVSAIKAFVLLELAERSGEFKRNGLVYSAVAPTPHTDNNINQ